MDRNIKIGWFVKISLHFMIYFYGLEIIKFYFVFYNLLNLKKGECLVNVQNFSTSFTTISLTPFFLLSCEIYLSVFVETSQMCHFSVVLFLIRIMILWNLVKNWILKSKYLNMHVCYAVLTSKTKAKSVMRDILSLHLMINVFHYSTIGIKYYNYALISFKL